jgi:hypothetical protein
MAWQWGTITGMIRTFFVAAAGLLTAALITSASLAGQQSRPANTPKAQVQAPPAAKPYQMKAAPATVALPPLPTVSFEPVEPMPIMRQVYEFAARHPEVLQYVPCYCGCENVGHTANHDCFVKSRAADGRVTQWDAHGMGCAVCMGVGRKAMTMFNRGMSVADIRAAIEKEYGSHYPSHTPTPAAPKTKKG